MPKTALITGITGQDGSYLAELLLAKGYEVHGVVRRSSTLNRGRIDHLQHANPSHPEGAKFLLHYGDMTDSGGLNRLVKTVRPDEIYNLGAEPRGSLLRPARIHRRRRRPRNYAAAGGDSHQRNLNAFLPGIDVKNVQPLPSSPKRDHAFSSAQPVRGGEAVRALDDDQLPRGARPLRVQRNPVQPRVAAQRRELRDPQDHPRDRADPRRQVRQDSPWQSGLQARLGPRARLRR